MLSDNTHCSLLEKLDDESCGWWDSYTEAITENDSWELDDAAVLAIAYLVESGCLTYEDVTKTTQALKRCSDWEIGKATFIERVMKDADKAKGELTMTKTVISLDNGKEVWTRMAYSDVIKALSNIGGPVSFVELVNMNGNKEAVLPAHVVAVYQA